MSVYDFDRVIERRATNCVKWDECPSADVVPLWVADMDFAVAPAIQRAVAQRAQHPIYGYAVVGDDYYKAVVNWFQRRHHWTIERSHILYTTGVVPAISAILKTLTTPGEKVLLQTPVYNCFFSSIRNQGCEPFACPLTLSDNRYTIDFEAFERACADEKCTVFLLCNPHNPAGRVWKREELQRMADICRKHQVSIVSDEIHCELVMPGFEYVPIATVMPEAIVCTSASKCFNIAGLQMANIICPDAETRRRIDRIINIREICDVNCFAAVAQTAAYDECADWIDELCCYLKGNYDALCEYFQQTMPRLSILPLEGTYLVWVDIRSLGMPSDVLCERLLNEHRVWLNAGTMYGQEGFLRINIACPRSTLMEGLRRMAECINTLE